MSDIRIIIVRSSACLLVRHGLVIPLLALAMAAALCLPGCGGDKGGGFRPDENLFRDPTSPENVLHNFEECFNSRNYGQFALLLHDDFTFEFLQDDVEQYPDDIPQDGSWSSAEMLNAVEKMLDEDYTPCDSTEKLDSIEMHLSLRDKIEDTAMEGAPPGTVEGFTALDFNSRSVGGTLYLTRSSPWLLFTPDSTETPVTWRIWRLRDSPYDFLKRDASTADSIVRVDTALAGAAQSAHAVEAGLIPTPVARPSWGSILAHYAADCD